MTQQEAFTKSVLGLRLQGYQRSTLPYNGCAYRDHKNKRRCAIGHILTDPEAHTMEGRGPAKHFLKINPDKIRSLIGLEIAFLDELQTVHDWGWTPAQMEDDLRKFAVKWKLEFPP